MSETTSESATFDAAAYTSQGTERESVRLPAELFDGTVNVPVMHQAVKAYLANQRQGNAATKTRGKVVGGNQKPWKQKGTGRARQGSIRAPNWVGGGTVFGPIPRSYAQYVPRQVRALARKSAFNARAREGAVLVVDLFADDAPKTRPLVDLLERLGIGERKVLLLTDGVKRNVYLSGRNLPLVHVLPYADVSTYDLLWSDVVVVESGAFGQPLAPIAEPERAARAPRAAPKARPDAEGRGSPKKVAKGSVKASAGAGRAKKGRATSPGGKTARGSTGGKRPGASPKRGGPKGKGT
jgi:large subunit ribosomal protein L4